MHLAYHTLRVHHRDSALEFYCNKLGMDVLRTATSNADGGVVTHDFLSFSDADREGNTQLELISSADFSMAKKTTATGYWKIGITLADVDYAVNRLRSQGVSVSDPHQFRDIGYLCHLDDPSGNTIELLQHYFERNKPGTPPDQHFPLGGQLQIGQITLRVKDPDKSLAFYRDTLCMKLLSRQQVEPYGFTLYFLACSDELPPVADIDAVENREWLWQRPYTTLELQHVLGTEKPGFTYDVSAECGFESLSFKTADFQSALRRCVSHNATIGTPIDSEFHGCDVIQVFDPDGYRINLLDNRS